MQENLVGYLMNALEADEHEQVDKYLEANPEARQQLDTLKRAIEPLEADKDSIDPPPLLAFQALALIAEHHCQPLTSVPETVPAADAPVETAPVWWRRADLLVAAALFFVFSGEVMWLAASVMALAALAGGVLGGKLAGRIKPSTLRWCVVAVGAAVGLAYLVR